MLIELLKHFRFPEIEICRPITVNGYSLALQNLLNRPAQKPGGPQDDDALVGKCLSISQATPTSLARIAGAGESPINAK